MRCVSMLLVLAFGFGLMSSAAGARGLMSTPAPILNQAFPDLKTAIDQVQSFDFQSAIKNEEHLKVLFAPAFGTLDADSVKLLDENVKVMIAGVTREVAKQPVSGRDFDTMLSKLSQNILIQDVNGSKIVRSDRFVTEDTDFFSFNGLSPDFEDVKEVETFLNTLVGDPDIALQSGVDINVLVDIIASASAIVDNLLSGFFDDANEERAILDVTVLRYPDADLPFFKIWRLQLSAFVESSRFVAVQSDKFGISGEFEVATFEPRQSIMDQLSQSTKAQAASEADALFD